MKIICLKVPANESLMAYLLGKRRYSETQNGRQKSHESQLLIRQLAREVFNVRDDLIQG